MKQLLREEMQKMKEYWWAFLLGFVLFVILPRIHFDQSIISSYVAEEVITSYSMPVDSTKMCLYEDTHYYKTTLHFVKETTSCFEQVQVTKTD